MDVWRRFLAALVGLVGVYCATVLGLTFWSMATYPSGAFWIGAVVGVVTFIVLTTWLLFVALR